VPSQRGHVPGLQVGQPGQGSGSPAGRGAGMSQLMEELAGGGNGLSSRSQMLNLGDIELLRPIIQSQCRSPTPFFNFSNDRFLKGLLIGAAAA